MNARQHPGLDPDRTQLIEAAAVESLTVPDTGATGAARMLNRHVEEREGPSLDEAEIVVSGGRGLGEAEKYQMIEDLAKAGPAKVILDMVDVSYIDSAGIGLVAMTSGRVKETGGKMAVLTAPEGRTTQLLKLTQVNALLPVCSTMDEAKAALA